MALLTSSMGQRGRALDAVIADWAAANPRVRRVWLFGSRAEPPAPDGAIDIALELQPVADSEETMTVWIANGDRWRAELQDRIGRTVELDWMDPDGATRAAWAGPVELQRLVYQRSG